jgi:hypothetical protein
VVGAVLAGLAGTALLAWPSVRLGATDDALARIVLPGFAGEVTAVDGRSADGTRVPVRRSAEVQDLAEARSASIS